MSNQYSEAGKGSSPRKQRDDDAYKKNWEAIFGKKKDEKKPDNESQPKNTFVEPEEIILFPDKLENPILHLD